MELNRLNLVWALGACLCPSLAAHTLRIANVAGIFSAVSLFFVLLMVWVLGIERDPGPATPTASSQWSFSLAAWPFALLIIIMLPGGVESSIGGWIATYMQRAQGLLATTVSAGSCFWGGLLLSRALSSTRLLERFSERAVLRRILLTIAAGALLMIATTSALGILPGVFLIGFGLGPVYPLLLAQALRFSENPLLFTIAGLGSAFLPWLTGVVSSASSSLRMGLLVPLTAALLMLALGLRLTSAGPAGQN
jgi:fucose permease